MNDLVRGKPNVDANQIFQLTIIKTSTIMNTDALENPYLSYRIPDTVGPMNAPSAKDEVHKPDTNPYVSKSFGSPEAL